MTNNPQKILPGRYQMVCRTLILLIQGNKVLLQKAAPTKKIWAGMYNGLGGHVERGEDILTAARRELLEEAGIESPDLSLRGMVTIDVENQQGILMFVFSGEEIKGTLRPSEEGQLEWADISQIKTLPTVEDIPALLGMLLENQAVFFGHYSYTDAGKLIPQFIHQPR
jgi:8-oxo-dGTP diphosphatase